jgi:homoserine O-acetyltransferase
VAYCELPSTYGHDAFLVEVAEQSEIVRGFLIQTHKQAMALAVAR